MSRGKEAARNANRRTEEAQAEVAVLKERIATLTAEHAHELVKLRAERDRARGDLSREVHRLAADEVAAIRQEAAAETAAVRDAHFEQVAQGMARLEAKSGATLKLQGLNGWVEVAEAFGVDAGPMIDRIGVITGDVASNREVRRSTNRHVRRKNRLLGE